MVVLCPFCDRNVSNINSHVIRGECSAGGSSELVSPTIRSKRALDAADAVAARPQKFRRLAVAEAHNAAEADVFHDESTSYASDAGVANVDYNPALDLSLGNEGVIPNLQSISTPNQLAATSSKSSSSDRFQQSCSWVFNSIGCSSKTEFDLLKLDID